MSPPADIDALCPAELKRLVLTLLEEVAELRRTVAAPRDEIARLKGGPGRQVTKCRISGGTRSDAGRDCRDSFLGLNKTCAKLGIAFRDHLGARLAVPGTPKAPARPELLGALTDHGISVVGWRSSARDDLRLIQIKAGFRDYPNVASSLSTGEARHGL